MYIQRGSRSHAIRDKEDFGPHDVLNPSAHVPWGPLLKFAEVQSYSHTLLGPLRLQPQALRLSRTSNGAKSSRLRPSIELLWLLNGVFSPVYHPVVPTLFIHVREGRVSHSSEPPMHLCPCFPTWFACLSPPVRPRFCQICHYQARFPTATQSLPSNLLRYTHWRRPLPVKLPTAYTSVPQPRFHGKGGHSTQ